MRTSQPKTVYLNEYEVPAFKVDHVDLRFELFEGGARVHSQLTVRRNPESVASTTTLELDGDGLTLESVSIDERPLTPQEYEDHGDALHVHDVPDRFVLGVVTWIEPHLNTRLEGLYRSSGMFCTKCEAQGFRCITYFPDRPDVMARYRTRIEADRAACPVLLSNGNEVERGELPDNRHFVTWEDPFPKPSYLFGLVAGDLVEKKDTFTTCSGRDIALRMYVESSNADKCDHALDSLKRSMRWDEQAYGREYDLDIFMIVAVDDFNMGAMENKGLNIFNSSCVLASPDTATDVAFQRIESIVAHEYFHNWSGNRVTCRDWFQLSLKEGFTVFRDGQFSADMGSATVKCIEDATLMRTAQFAEDAGPMAHPVRPEAYMEITNFYTLTIYEKGAQVVRMLHTLLGPELFRSGSDLYFDRHDGQAVTTDDFVRAMEDVSKRDLTQFRLWYEQAGTPVVTVTDEYDEEQQVYRLTLVQTIPDTPGQSGKRPQHIPFAVGLLGEDGQDLPLYLSAPGEPKAAPCVLELIEDSQVFEFHGVQSRPVPSLFRGFSAPVRVHYPWTSEQLTFLMSHDSDGFNRWDAGQRMAIDAIQSLMDGGSEVDTSLVSAYRNLLSNTAIDQALVARMLELPSEAYLIELSDEPEVQVIHQARNRVLSHLANELRDDLITCYERNTTTAAYELSPESIARRSLRNTALSWLLHIGDEQGRVLALEQFSNASNMTDRLGALKALVNSEFVADREATLAAFYERWQADPLVVEQWFSVQAASATAGNLDGIERLLGHPAFDWKNPNKIRSVIGVFAGQNLAEFHRGDSAGYRFLAEQVKRLDGSNPQIAARLITPLTRWGKFAPTHSVPMKQALQSVRDKEGLSSDVYEVVHKSLTD